VNSLVLSLFPGIGLLDQAFEEEGFCVVRGPDLLWGGDICNFHPTHLRFDGIIGGPPCQSWSGLGNVNRARWGDECMMPDRIPEFARCVNEAKPSWFLMENVPQAPAPDCPGYEIYAPGPYVSFCVDCDAEFMGHQLAVRCEQCGAGKYDSISIINATCVSCEQEHPVTIIEHAASADTHPKDGDSTEIEAPLGSGAVGNAETPKGSPSHTEGGER
jgi:hypothetical protein